MLTRRRPTRRRRPLHGGDIPTDFPGNPNDLRVIRYGGRQQQDIDYAADQAFKKPAPYKKLEVRDLGIRSLMPWEIAEAEKKQADFKDVQKQDRIDSNERAQDQIRQNTIDKAVENVQGMDLGAMNPYKPVIYRLIEQEGGLYGTAAQMLGLFRQLLTTGVNHYQPVANYLSKPYMLRFLSLYINDPKNTAVVLSQWKQLMNDTSFRNLRDDEVTNYVQRELDNPGTIAQAAGYYRTEARKSSSQKTFEKVGKVLSQIADGLSTAVSFIPGIGTAVSAGLDAANFAYQTGTQYFDAKELASQTHMPNYQFNDDPDESGGSIGGRKRYAARQKRKKAFKPILSGKKRMHWIKHTTPIALAAKAE